MLEERELLLGPLPVSEKVMPLKKFQRILERRMSRHPSWKVLSLHPAEVDMPNPHFKIHDRPMFVVEITGPQTGNCFDFYEATDGDYWGGACFYPTRS